MANFFQDIIDKFVKPLQGSSQQANNQNLTSPIAPKKLNDALKQQVQPSIKVPEKMFTPKKVELPKSNFFADMVNKSNKSMTFNVGEGLTSDQNKTAMAIISKPSTPALEESFLGSFFHPESIDITRGKLAQTPSALGKLGIIGMAGLSLIPIIPELRGVKLGAKTLVKIAEEAQPLKIFEILKKEIPNITDDMATNLSGILKDITETKKIQPIVNKFLSGATETEKYVAEQITKRATAQKAESPGIIGGIKNLYNETKVKLVDFAAPIEDTLRTATKKSKITILPEADITNQIDRVLRSPTIAGQFARDNGLENVIKKVDNLDNLDQYLIAKHSQTLAEKGIATGRDLVKDSKLIQDFAPQYEETAKVVNQYSQKLLDYSVESGLVSKDLAAQLKTLYPYYVPMNRVFNELEKAGGQGSKAIASLSKQTVVQKIVGSEREVESPLNSLLAKTADAFKQGEKNKAARMLASYEKLPDNPFQLRELTGGESAPHTISFLDNGIKRVFETTQDIANAAKALNAQQLNILGKIFALPVRIAKVGITGINLPFIASNIAKDQVTAIINSKNALKTSIANPAVFIKALFEAVGHGKLYDEMAREGALGTSFDIARNQVPLTLERIRAGKSIGSKILYTVKHPSELLRAVENIVGRSEEFTRIQQYAGTKGAELTKGMSEEQAKIIAARAARENTVNFARRGEWGQVLNSAFLYLNASIQGTRTFVRNLSQRPIATASKIALTVFTPIAAATAWNLSDEKRKAAYDDIAEYEKQNNIIIIPPNPTKEDGTWNIIKIPLSQEINNLAGMARRPIEQAYGLDPVSVKDIASAFVGTISPINPATGSMASSLTPQAIRPSIEALTNTNLFTGIPQVPQSLEKLSPELQAKDWTSGTARKIGGMANLSPLKIEAFIKGTLGGVGAQFLNVSDRILAGLDIIPKDQIGGQDTIKAIIARFAKARGGHADDKSNTNLENILQKQADESFRIKQEAEILYAELKNTPKDKLPDEVNKINSIQKNNPQLYNKLKDVITSEQKGLTYNDRLMLQLGVENGQRAKFIVESIKAFPTNEEKAKYLNDLRQKKILTDAVLKQITGK